MFDIRKESIIFANSSLDDDCGYGFEQICHFVARHSLLIEH